MIFLRVWIASPAQVFNSVRFTVVWVYSAPQKLNR